MIAASMSKAGADGQLDYGKAMPWKQRRVTKAVVLAVILLAVLVGWRWGPAVRDRINLLILQQQCKTYQPPSDRIMFTTDPADYGRLLKGDEGYFGATSVFGDTRPDGTAIPPAYVWYECQVWRKFPNGGWGPGPVFLHSRRTPGGEERLIALELGIVEDRVSIFCRNFKPGSLFNAGDLSRSPLTDGGGFGFRSPIRLYAGQPDPNDGSAFTMRVESGGRSTPVRARVLDDGTITIEAPDELDPSKWPERKNP